jgi:hypothetical protein
MMSHVLRLLHIGKATFGCDFGEKRENGREIAKTVEQ